MGNLDTNTGSEQEIALAECVASAWGKLIEDDEWTYIKEQIARLAEPTRMSIARALCRDARRQMPGYQGNADSLGEIIALLGNKKSGERIRRRAFVQQMGLELDAEEPYEALEIARMLCEEGLLSKKDAKARMKRFAEMLDVELPEDAVL